MFHFLISFFVCWWEIPSHLSHCSCVVNVFLFSGCWVLLRFVLFFVFSFTTLSLLCGGLGFFGFTLLGVCCYICSFMFLDKFEQLQPLFPVIFFLSLYFVSSLWYSGDMTWELLLLSHWSLKLCSFFCFLCSFSCLDGIVFVTPSSSSLNLCCIISILLLSPFTVLFISYLVFNLLLFISWIYFLF